MEYNYGHVRISKYTAKKLPIKRTSLPLGSPLVDIAITTAFLLLYANKNSVVQAFTAGVSDVANNAHIMEKSTGIEVNFFLNASWKVKTVSAALSFIEGKGYYFANADTERLKTSIGRAFNHKNVSKGRYQHRLRQAYQNYLEIAE